MAYFDPSELPPSGFDRLVAVMDRLRDHEHGCPWDLEQSLRTLKQYLVEEAAEALDAIDALGPAADALPGQTASAPSDAIDAHRDELGDVLLQVVFQARIAKEMGWYDASDVATAIADKMVRRHPHVFNEAQAQRGDVTTASEVVNQWQRIKAEEKTSRAEKSLLDGVPRHLPGLMRGQALGRKAAKVGFDWPGVGGAIDKVDEELAELKEALAGGDQDRIEAEMGDVLFALSSVARKSGVDAERALRRSLDEFMRRFRYIEHKLQTETGRSASLDLMESWWQQAKDSK